MEIIHYGLDISLTHGAITKSVWDNQYMIQDELTPMDLMEPTLTSNIFVWGNFRVLPQAETAMASLMDSKGTTSDAVITGIGLAQRVLLDANFNHPKTVVYVDVDWDVSSIYWSPNKRQMVMTALLMGSFSATIAHYGPAVIRYIQPMTVREMFNLKPNAPKIEVYNSLPLKWSNLVGAGPIPQTKKLFTIWSDVMDAYLVSLTSAYVYWKIVKDNIPDGQFFRPKIDFSG